MPGNYRLISQRIVDGLNKLVIGGKQTKAVMFRYADDFVVHHPKGQVAVMHGRLKSWLEKKVAPTQREEDTDRGG